MAQYFSLAEKEGIVNHNLYSTKIDFSNEGEIKTFSGEKNPTQFSTNRHEAKRMAKGNSLNKKKNKRRSIETPRQKKRTELKNISKP